MIFLVFFYKPFQCIFLVKCLLQSTARKKKERKKISPLLINNLVLLWERGITSSSPWRCFRQPNTPIHLNVLKPFLKCCILITHYLTDHVLSSVVASTDNHMIWNVPQYGFKYIYCLSVLQVTNALIWV